VDLESGGEIYDKGNATQQKRELNVEGMDHSGCTGYLKIRLKPHFCVIRCFIYA
jgi:hypothetical protein